MFKETNCIPDGLLETKAEDLLALLGAPTLIHLEGTVKKPLFISTLLHGNETTGFYAVQSLLNAYKDKALPRSLSIFIGNVEAAAQSARRLDTQVDYNRIWPGTHHSDSAETDMMKNITNIMRKRKPFASVDVHNNTGYNPHYACVNILNPHCLQLAGMFTNTVVYFTSPKGVQSSSFSDFCPALVLECGQSGEADGVNHSMNFLDAVLNLDSLPSDQPEHINLYHTVCRVIIPGIYSFGTSRDTDLMLSHAMEKENFKQLNKNTVFSSVKENSNAHLVAFNESDEDVSDDFFEIIDNKILLKKDVTLSMYTTNEKAVSQDCLCYLMERISFS